MEKIKKILLFYIIGIVFTYWLLAIIHLNYPIFKDFFWRSSLRRVCKNAIIYGAPIGAAFWIYMSYKFPLSSLNFKFIVNFLKPSLYNYLIGILLAFGIILCLELYTYLFSTEYLNSTFYNIFGFSALLGILLAIGYHKFKKS
jgi:hypothetical protein